MYLFLSLYLKTMKHTDTSKPVLHCRIHISFSLSMFVAPFSVNEITDPLLLNLLVWLISLYVTNLLLRPHPPLQIRLHPSGVLTLHWATLGCHPAYFICTLTPHIGTSQHANALFTQPVLQNSTPGGPGTQALPPCSGKSVSTFTLLILLGLGYPAWVTGASTSYPHSTVDAYLSWSHQWL